MNKHIVVVNQIPPTHTNILSPISFIMKNYLDGHELTTNVICWDTQLVELQNSFLWGDYSDIRSDDDNFLLLFYNYLALKEEDEKACINVKARLMSLKPNHTTSEVAFYHRHMKLFAQKLDEAITQYIKEIYSDEIICFFFSIDSKYQWICASIIAEKIKDLYPGSTVVIGGIEHKKTAAEYLQMFAQFDFAVWGETEKTLLGLCKYLVEENQAYENIPHLAFRQNSVVLTSSNKKEWYVSLADRFLKPDYSDLFRRGQGDELTFANPVIGIEIARGNRCKPVARVVDEILYFISEYHVNAFHFSRYDLTNNNRAKLDQLLDALIRIKEQFPDFSISLFSVMAKMISPATLRKMMMAGFYSIRIIYISSSENLLNKYGMQSTFADNLLLVKFTSLYNIILTEADVIMGIPEETDEDILQSISNLYYLRFFFKSGQLRHRLRKMEVFRHDRCYQQVKADRENWDIEPSLKRFLPSGYLKKEGKSINILGLVPVLTNPLWNDFKQAESYFIKNSFEYKLYRKVDNTILYKELFNNNVINEFELDEMDWFILEKANSQVISIEFLMKEIRDKIKKEFMDIEIINVLENLRFERLIYLSDDYKEIVSVINTELVV